MQASQLTPSHTSMSDLIRLPLLYNLAHHIETILKRYLHSRFGLTPTDFDDSPALENIIEILDKDPNTYINKRLSESSVTASDGSTYQYVKRALVKGAVAVKQLTGKDGRSRLDSLRWLCLCLRRFQNYQSEFLKLTDAEQGEGFKEKVTAEIKIFFAEINVWLNTLPANICKPELLTEDKKYVMFGLKDDPTKLAELLSENLLLVFRPESIIASTSQDIAAHCTRLANVKSFREQEKRKQDEVLALKSKLEVSDNAVRDLQSALHAIEQQSQSFVHELRIKRMQEATYERRIEKLIQEKNGLEAKRQSNHRTDETQLELEAKQQELDDILLEQKLFQEEAEQLQLDAADAKERQTVLQQELSKLNGHNVDLSRQFDQPIEAVEVVEYEDELPEDDTFDIDKFSQHVSLTNKFEKHKKSASANGLTLAQHFVLTKRPEYLRALLQSPNLDDRPVDMASGRESKSLVELIMFEMPRLTLPSTKNNLLKIVFEFSPDLPRSPIQDLVCARYQKEGCAAAVVDTYCQYAIAYNTCSVSARKDFLSVLKKIKEYSEALKSTPFVSLLDELGIPLAVCLMLEKCYIKGAFSALKPLIEDETPLANAALYEVVYNSDRVLEADAQHKKSHGEFPIRVRLINRLNQVNDTLNSQYQDVARTVKQIGENYTLGFEMSVKQMEVLRDLMEKKAAAQPKQKMAWIPKAEVTESQVLAAKELVFRVIALINRYGVVLNVGAFNEYQCREITKRIQEEQRILEVHDVPAEENKQQYRRP